MNNIAIACHPMDIQLARQVALDLKAAAETWIRLENIAIGGDWRGEMASALKASDLMLLILSPEAMRDELVTEEWERFLRLGKPLVPLYWRECEPNYKLSRLQYVDFRREIIPYERALNYLLAELAQDYYVSVNLRKPREITSSSGKRFVAEIIQEQTGQYPKWEPPQLTSSDSIIASWAWIALSALVLVVATVISAVILFYT